MTGSCCGSDALRGVLPGGLYRTVSDVFCVCQIMSGCGLWHDCSWVSGRPYAFFICPTTPLHRV